MSLSCPSRQQRGAGDLSRGSFRNRVGGGGGNSVISLNCGQDGWGQWIGALRNFSVSFSILIAVLLYYTMKIYATIA